MVPITYITCRQSRWLYFAVCNADIWFCNISLHLSLCVSAFMSLCVALSLSLSSLGLFICWLLYLCYPLLFLYCLSPWQSIWWFHPIPVDCLSVPSSLASPTAVYPAPSPDTGRPCMIFCLFLWLSRISPLWTPLSQQSCQIKITSLKIQSTLLPTNSEGLLVGYSCIQVYIVSWSRCIRRSPTWQFHQNLMYSFTVTSKLCLFVDNRDVYQGPGGQESRQAHADRFLIGQVLALHLSAM